MEKEDTISVQWAQEDVETSYNLLNNNNRCQRGLCYDSEYGFVTGCVKECVVVNLFIGWDKLVSR
jgi:tetrahydromethanopterin S-methyltransferase subunit F